MAKFQFDCQDGVLHSENQFEVWGAFWLGFSILSHHFKGDTAMRVVALVVVCCCLTATGAFAQQSISCDQIALIAATGPDFKPFRGKVLDNGDAESGKTWRGKVSLSGAKCVVYDGDYNAPPEYLCTWNSKSKAEIAHRYNAVLGAVKTCKQWHIAHQESADVGADDQGNRTVGVLLLTDQHKYGFKVLQNISVKDASQVELDVFRRKDYDYLLNGGQ
jgi:hypothetical protein